MILIVMGICGCGKSTVGALLANSLNLPFYDADDFHPAENIAKMKRGIPLDDDDRVPWLQALAEILRHSAEAGGAVLACSALKKTYRDILQSGPAEVIRYVYLKGDRALIIQRMQGRKDHFMPCELVDSQLAILEEPDQAIVVPMSLSLSQICTIVTYEVHRLRLL